MEALLRQLSATLPEGIEPLPPGDAVEMIAEEEPRAFWSRLMGCLRADTPAALIDPSWPRAWREEAGHLLAKAALPGNSILIPTSGSTGRPKFCIHDPDTLMAAAYAFRERFGPAGIPHSVNVLPPFHVGGLMPVLRSAACGGLTTFVDYRDLSRAREAPLPLAGAALSLVPTQLGRLLQSSQDTALLQEFGLILVGGAACPATVLDRARSCGLRLAPCYGSTETAAMVTVLDPGDFLSGTGSVGHALPGMEVEVEADGRLLIHSPSTCHGYLPAEAAFSRDPFPTTDIGELGTDGLRIIGRADRVIISGGKNVHPEQVEAAAMATGLVADARCEGVKDPDWGQRVRLLVVPGEHSKDLLSRLESALRAALPPYAVPKEIHPREALPRGPGGKSRL